MEQKENRIVLNLKLIDAVDLVKIMQYCQNTTGNGLYFEELAKRLEKRLNKTLNKNKGELQ